MKGRRSVSRVLSTVCTAEIVIHLGRPSPDASSNLPGSFCGPQHVLPYLVLLQPGFALPLPLPTVRCALTAPFHPYLYIGGIFSVALSVGLRLPGVTWRLALWSPDFPPSINRQRLSDRLPGTNIVSPDRNCKRDIPLCRRDSSHKTPCTGFPPVS